MTHIIIGSVYLLTSFIPSMPDSYFGEALFGKKLVKYEHLDKVMAAIGGAFVTYGIFW